MKKASTLFILCILPILIFSYTLRVGDTIGISVFGYPQYSMQNIVVDQDGVITVPPLGRIKVAGFEVSEVESILIKKLQSYVKTNNVTVGIVNYAPFIVNVFGNTGRNGSININKSSIKLSELIGLVGGLKDFSNSSKALVTYPTGETKEYDISWIYNGTSGTDPLISENCRVVIPYDYNNKINIFSEFNTKSISYFKGVTLKYILSDQPLPISEIDDTVTILRNNKVLTFSINNVITKNDVPLEKNDTIILKKVKNYVYLSGSFNINGRLDIPSTEKLTLIKLLSLSRGFTSDFSGKIDVLKDGNMKVYNINPNDINTYKDITFEPKSTIIAEKADKRAYIIGDISDLKNYNYGDTLYDLLIPYQLNEAYKIEYSIDNEKGSVFGNDFEKEKNVLLKGKVIIKVSKEKSNEVVVYKEGTTRIINKNKVTIMDVISAINGFSPVNRGSLKIYKNNTLLKTYTEKNIWQNTLEEVPMGSYVVVQPETQYSYITILGNVTPQNIKTDIPINLVELLSSTNYNWEIQDEVTIYYENHKEVVKTKDIEKIKNYKVDPGSIIFINKAKPKLIYAFGELKKQGTIEYVKGLTLLDYLFRMGGITKSGEPTKVFLFKNGPENPPITVDISGILNSKPIKSPMNPELNPGDIIFVPKNALTGVFEVMNTVTTFMNFIKTGTDTYTTVTNALK